MYSNFCIIDKKSVKNLYEVPVNKTFKSFLLTPLRSLHRLRNDAVKSSAEADDMRVINLASKCWDSFRIRDFMEHKIYGFMYSANLQYQQPLHKVSLYIGTLLLKLTNS